ncbi:PEX5- protein [Ameca splendens]|uniref:PEX5- protein n=1 Tax=Ameca splendens TaxID=208324 RepID=A0ABV0Y1P9_9TELE
MVLKEIPSKASSEGKPLLTVTTKLVSEQQESRPLLSPSIDDFLCETKCDGISRPVTSNTAAAWTPAQTWIYLQRLTEKLCLHPAR